MQAADVSLLVEQHGKELYRYCCRLTGCVSQAEDLYQQTFLKCLELNQDVDFTANPRAFLFALAGGVWKNQLRKTGRRMAILRPVELDAPDAPDLAAAENLERQTAVKARDATLQAAIGQLAPKYRIPLVLSYGFDWTVEQIAKAERVPQGTIKSRLHKARQLLKKEMEAKGYDTAQEF